MKKLFALLAVLFVSIGAKADINVWSTSINGVNGYGIYSWENPGELADFLNGSYQGRVWYENVEKTGTALTELLNNIKAAQALKFGGSANAPQEEINQSDIEAVFSKLENVVYLRMDGSTSAPNLTLDFTNVTVTSSSLKDVSLPSGLSKSQIEAANTKIKATASGLDLVVGISGSVITTQVPHYWYTVNGVEYEYTGDITDGQTSIEITDFPLMANLTPVVGYPRYSYTNPRYNNKTCYVAENDVQIVNINNVEYIVPSQITVLLTPNYKYYVMWNGVKTEITTANTNGNPIEPLLSFDIDNGEWKVKESYKIWFGGNSVEAGTVVEKETNGFTYVQRDWQSTSIANYNGPYTTDADDNFIATINNAYTGGQYGEYFPKSNLEYLYTYTDKNGVQQTYNQYDEDGQIQIDEISGTYDLVTRYEYPKTFTVDGMVACVNNAGSLSHASSYMFGTSYQSGSSLYSYKNAKNITILGNIGEADLDELSATNFASANLIDMSGAVLDGNITTISSKATAATVLPKIKVAEGSPRCVTTAELGTIQTMKDSNNNYYNCVAFFDSSDENRLYVYSGDCKTGNVANLAPVIKQELTFIEFLPYYNTDGTYKERAGVNDTDLMKPFWEALPELPAVGFDFTLISAYLNADFTNLSQFTHYLTVAQNTNAATAAVDFTNDTQASNYKYSDNIYVVSTYKHPVYATGYAQNASYAGKGLAVTETTNIIYVRNQGAGHLSSAINNFSKVQKEAVRQIVVGDINSDISAFNTTSLESTKYDLSPATVTNENIVSFNNPIVEYLALPDNTNEAINATSADVCNYRDVNNSSSSKCPALLCVGAYNTTTNTLTTWSGEVGGVYSVTTMIRPQLDEYTDANGQTHTNQRGKNNICYTLENVVMSGRLNWDDISVNNGNGLDNGLESASIKTADLTNAYFPDNDDMNLSTAGWTGMTSIKLPTDARMLTIPANCFYNCQSLTDLCIPSNFEEIGESAFASTNITHIYTTPYNGDANGNGADNFTADEYDDQGNLISSVYDHGANTITLSSNLKKIHTKAFNFNDHTLVTDVYVLAKTAPECEVDAFSSFMLMGNGGFAGNWAHPVTRENYKNSDGYFMILHFPNDAEDPQNYTDIKRNYSLVDETGLYDGNGNLVRWPNHTEIYRAYNQAMTGATWNDWIYLTENDFNQTKASYKGQYTQEYMEGGLDWATADALAQAKVDALYPSYGECKYNTRLLNGNLVDAIATFADGSMTADYYKTGDNIPYETTPSYPMASSTSLGYTGWHQFILADYSRFADVQKSTNYVWGGYYTLCFPYDLTREQVIKYLGAPASIDNVQVKLEDEVLNAAALPKVYTLKSVTRNNPNINLQFSKDLMKLAEGVGKKTIAFDEDGHYDYDGTISTDAYIKAGYPYLVKPILPADKASSVTNLGQYILSIAEDLSSDQITSTYNNAMAPKIDHKVIATSEGGDVKWQALKTQENAEATAEYEESNYNYYFQGTYNKEYMPIYCYFLGAGTTKIYRNMLHTRVWNPFTCIIIGKCKDKAVKYEMGGSSTDTSDNARGKFSTLSVLPLGNNDDFVDSSNSVKYKFTIEEDGEDVLVAIDKLDGDTLNNVTETGKVYNVTGQYVGESLNGLSKGMYIINGKKILVK